MFDNSKILKYNSAGLVDVPATELAFHEALADYAAVQKADTEGCAAAVAKVWEENPNTSVMALDNLATLAAFKITSDATQFGTVKERCLSHIRTAKALYKIAKGRSGGVSRVKPETAQV